MLLHSRPKLHHYLGSRFLASGSRFPVKVSRFPGKESRFPIKVSRFPVKVSRFPVKVPRFPVKESRFPVKESRFPVKVSRFPGKESRFPGKESRFPGKVPRFPTSGSRFPLRFPLVTAAATPILLVEIFPPVASASAHNWHSSSKTEGIKLYHIKERRLPIHEPSKQHRSVTASQWLAEPSLQTDIAAPCVEDACPSNYILKRRRRRLAGNHNLVLRSRGGRVSWTP